MATILCPSCQNKRASHISGGNCNGKPSGANCTAITASLSIKLCDSCAANQNMCKMCMCNLSGVGTTPTPTVSGIVFITARDADNGKTFSSMKVGEQIHIELDEDQWSGKEWDVKSTGVGLSRQLGSQFIQDPTNYQYGTRKFVIDIRQAASGISGGVIELHEVYRSWYYRYSTTAVPGGKTWKILVDVK